MGRMKKGDINSTEISALGMFTTCLLLLSDITKQPVHEYSKGLN
jgi:hypothetical protein